MTEIDRLDHNFERNWVFKRLDLVKMGGFWDKKKLPTVTVGWVYKWF